MKLWKTVAACLAAALIATAVSTADAQNKKTTVAKERAAGTTGDVGNRCPGGTYNSCLTAIMKNGVTARGAANHCTRTCAK